MTFLLHALLLTQQVVAVGNLTFSDDAFSSAQQYLTTQTSRNGGRLNSGINGVVTSVTYTADASGVLVNGDVILINNEAIAVTNVTGSTLTLIRSVLGTSAAPHANQSQIVVLKYRSVVFWAKALVQAAVAEAMEGNPAGVITTQNAAIAAAIAAKEAAKAVGVQ